jgi:hypothetical protein
MPQAAKIVPRPANGGAQTSSTSTRSLDLACRSVHLNLTRLPALKK